MAVREGAYGTVSVRMFARPSEEPCNEKRREEDKAHEQVYAVSGKRAFPSTESARCSLLGEAERLAVGQSLRKAPKFLVQPDVAVQPGDGARAREAFAIRTAARLVFQSAAQQIFANPIQDPPKIFASVFVAACFKQFLWADGGLLHIFITESQRGRCERAGFSTGQLPCAVMAGTWSRMRKLASITSSGVKPAWRIETLSNALPSPTNMPFAQMNR